MYNVIGRAILSGHSQEGTLVLLLSQCENHRITSHVILPSFIYRILCREYLNYALLYSLYYVSTYI